MSDDPFADMEIGTFIPEGNSNIFGTGYDAASTGGSGAGFNLEALVIYASTPETTRQVWHPPTLGTPGTPGIPGSVAVSYLKNSGWTTSARSIEELPVGGYYEFSVADGVGGACLGIGPDGMDGMGIAVFSHSVICDRDGVHIHELSTLVQSLKARQYSTSILRIYRLSTGEIKFICTTDTEVLEYTSTTEYPTFYPLYIYGLLYDSGDSIITSLIDVDGVAGNNSVTFNLNLGMRFQDSLIGDNFVRFDLELDMYVRPSSRVEFSLELDMLLRSSANYGYAELPPLLSIGGQIPEGYGVGYALLPRLYSHGAGGFYIPPPLEYGFAFLPRLVSFGVVKTSCPGNGSATLPALRAKGGEGDYGEGSSTLPLLRSVGYEGPPKNEAHLISYCALFDGIISPFDQIIFVGEVGHITDTITGTRAAIDSIIASLQISDTYTVLGDFVVSAMSGGNISTSMSSTRIVVETTTTTSTSDTGTVGEEVTAVTGDGGEVTTTTVTVTEDTPGEFTTTTVVEVTIEPPSVDSTARVWVVNVDTGASWQYDDYGFNSWFERDGEYFGLAEDGIYQLTGGTDCGLPIPWRIDFGTTDCGVPGRKKIINFHVGTTDGSKMYLLITTEEGTHTYAVEPCRRGATGWRVKVPYNFQGSGWNFTLIAEGAEELDGIEFYPIKLSRRL